MNNEPVAWMGKDYDGLKTDLYFDVERNKLPYRLYESAIPLYTHPVKEAKYGITTKWDGITTYHETTEPIEKVKELTDEEIVNLYKETEADNGGIREFARAILRKAQEK
jgi:hypothetical protein